MLSLKHCSGQGKDAYKVMQPIYRGIVIVRQPFSYRRCGQRSFLFADVRGDDGLRVFFMLEAIEAVVVLWEQLRALVGGLLEVGGRGSHDSYVGAALG